MPYIAKVFNREYNEYREKKQVLEKDYGIPMSIELEKEVNSMCNLSEAIEEQGIEKGL